MACVTSCGKTYNVRVNTYCVYTVNYIINITFPTERYIAAYAWVFFFYSFKRIRYFYIGGEIHLLIYLSNFARALVESVKRII